MLVIGVNPSNRMCTGLDSVIASPKWIYITCMYSMYCCKLSLSCGNVVDVSACGGGRGPSSAYRYLSVGAHLQNSN